MQKRTFDIRPAAIADLPRLGRLGGLIVDLHYGFDPQRFLKAKNRTPADYAIFLREQLSDPDVVVLVAEDHGDVIGYAYAEMQGYDYMSLRGPAGVLQDIVVDSEYRNRGTGRALLSATIAALEQRAAPRVVLSTAARNEAAQRLFTSAGFRTTMIEMTREIEKPAEVAAS